MKCWCGAEFDVRRGQHVRVEVFRYEEVVDENGASWGFDHISEARCCSPAHAARWLLSPRDCQIEAWKRELEGARFNVDGLTAEQAAMLLVSRGFRIEEYRRRLEASPPGLLPPRVLVFTSGAGFDVQWS